MLYTQVVLVLVALSVTVAIVVYYTIINRQNDGLCSFTDNNKIKVACVGDSITANSYLSNSEKYPSQLANLLGSDKYQVCNFGNGGKSYMQGPNAYSNTPEFQRVLQSNPDIIIVQLGTNDSSPLGWKNQTVFEQDVTSLLTQFINMKSKPIIFVSLPPPIFNPAFNENNNNLLNGVIPGIRNVANKLNLQLIDVHGAFMQNNEPVKAFSIYFIDGIHPNAYGCNIMANTIYLGIDRALKLQ